MRGIGLDGSEGNKMRGWTLLITQIRRSRSHCPGHGRRAGVADV
jgi:hypothetical protein